jgi:hypothetical protein
MSGDTHTLTAPVRAPPRHVVRAEADAVDAAIACALPLHPQQGAVAPDAPDAPGASGLKLPLPGLVSGSSWSIDVIVTTTGSRPRRSRAATGA